MAYIYYNPNNRNKHNDHGDCVVRAISKATGQSWDRTYLALCGQGFLMGDWGNSNKVWDSYLRGYGFMRKAIPNTCPDCYTVEDFEYDHPYGTFILATGSHTVCVKDGNHYDSWDSSKEVPILYYEK